MDDMFEGLLDDSLLKEAQERQKIENEVKNSDIFSSVFGEEESSGGSFLDELGQMETLFQDPDSLTELRKEETEYTKQLDEKYRMILGTDNNELGERVIESSSFQLPVSEPSLQNDVVEYGEDDSRFYEIDEESTVNFLRGQFDKEMQESEFNFNNAVTTIQEEVLEEYILVDGLYTSTFKSFMQSPFILERGDYPLAISYEGAPIHFISINPEPKNLYRLLKILTGFKITLVTPDGEKPLTPYSLMNKAKFTLGG